MNLGKRTAAFHLPSCISAAVAVLIILFPFHFKDTQDLLIYLGFAINAGVGAYFFMHHHNAYSITLMYWLFQLVFFGLVPAFQYRLNAFPWDLPVMPRYMLSAHLLIIFCAAVFWYTVHRRQSRHRNTSEPVHIYFQPVPFLKWGFVIFILAALLIVLIVGPANLWHRSKLELAAQSYPQSVFLLINGICRSWMILYFLIILRMNRFKMVAGSTVAFITVIMLITHFPMALNRNLAAIVWGSAMLIVAHKMMAKRYTFRMLLLLAVMLVYPLLNLLRFNSAQIKNYNSDWRTVIASSFGGGDFDAYANLTHSMRVVAEHGLSLGWQLLSALLFFVPRSIWPEKGIGSGAYIFGKLESDKFNVSAPLIAEGFINFGWLGALLFIMAFAFVAKAYDHWFWHHLREKVTLGKVFYPPMVMASLNFLRGDLMSNMALMSGFFFVLLIMHYSFWYADKKK